MADKIAPGVWHEDLGEPAAIGHVHFEEQKARLRKRRDGGTWYVIVGVGMLFAASISTAFVAGGVLLVLWGAATYLWFSVRLGKLEDPWNDEELDRWEAEHLKSHEAEGLPSEADDEWRDL